MLDPIKVTVLTPGVNDDGTVGEFGIPAAVVVRFLDTKRANFVRNAKDIYGFDDCATVPHTTCYEGLRGDGSCAPDHYINPGDFTWALHNYYLHYRYSMDRVFLRDVAYPFMKGAMRVYEAMLEDDGTSYVLPVSVSPAGVPMIVASRPPQK